MKIKAGKMVGWIGIISSLAQGLLIPNETSGVIQTPYSLYLSPGETAYIDLENYFRGSFMSYSLKASIQLDNGT